MQKYGLRISSWDIMFAIWFLDDVNEFLITDTLTLNFTTQNFDVIDQVLLR